MKRGGWVLKSAVYLLFFSCFSLGVTAETLPADPTKPAFNVEVGDLVEKAQQYSVSSLITGKKQNLAVINGQRVKVGDAVDGAKVIAVSRKGVQLEVSGEKKFISIAERQGFSKTKSAK